MKISFKLMDLEASDLDLSVPGSLEKFFLSRTQLLKRKKLKGTLKLHWLIFWKAFFTVGFFLQWRSQYHQAQGRLPADSCPTRPWWTTHQGFKMFQSSSCQAGDWACLNLTHFLGAREKHIVYLINWYDKYNVFEFSDGFFFWTWLQLPGANDGEDLRLRFDSAWVPITLRVVRSLLVLCQNCHCFDTTQVETSMRRRRLVRKYDTT